MIHQVKEESINVFELFINFECTKICLLFELVLFGIILLSFPCFAYDVVCV